MYLSLIHPWTVNRTCPTLHSWHPLPFRTLSALSFFWCFLPAKCVCAMASEFRITPQRLHVLYCTSAFSFFFLAALVGFPVPSPVWFVGAAPWSIGCVWPVPLIWDTPNESKMDLAVASWLGVGSVIIAVLLGSLLSGAKPTTYWTIGLFEPCWVLTVLHQSRK